MSSKTTDNGQSRSKKPPLRLQIPVDNPDVEAFLAAQGPRNQSQAIVMLIRMWVNEFGPTSVMEQTMGATTLSRLKQDSQPRHTPVAVPTVEPAVAHPIAVPEPVPARVQEPAAPERNQEPEIPEPPVAEKVVPATPAVTQPAPPAPAPSNDIDDLFRRR